MIIRSSTFTPRGPRRKVNSFPWYDGSEAAQDCALEATIHDNIEEWGCGGHFFISIVIVVQK